MKHGRAVIKSPDVDPGDIPVIEAVCLEEDQPQGQQSKGAEQERADTDRVRGQHRGESQRQPDGEEVAHRQRPANHPVAVTVSAGHQRPAGAAILLARQRARRQDSPGSV